MQNFAPYGAMVFCYLLIFDLNDNVEQNNTILHQAETAGGNYDTGADCLGHILP
jgi:hypothetical protein